MQRSVLNLFALTESDPQQRITVLISFQFYFHVSSPPPPPPLKDYPGFQLNQSCLWLEIMSMFPGLQMNTVAPGLLSSTQSRHADTFEEGRKEKPWPSETN